MKRLVLIREFLAFLAARKRFVLIPVAIVFLIIGGLLVAVQGSALAPFIYALF